MHPTTRPSMAWSVNVLSMRICPSGGSVSIPLKHEAIRDRTQRGARCGGCNREGSASSVLKSWSVSLKSRTRLCSVAGTIDTAKSSRRKMMEKGIIYALPEMRINKRPVSIRLYGSESLLCRRPVLFHLRILARIRNGAPGGRACFQACAQTKIKDMTMFFPCDPENRLHQYGTTPPCRMLMAAVFGLFLTGKSFGRARHLSINLKKAFATESQRHGD